ncbi:MAG: xanthine dehydrogenase family protein molybdopterin-binding subunit [Planctomycetota bacterium]|jgi:xanthine dehydrogenase molybdenum-binding subunit
MVDELASTLSVIGKSEHHDKQVLDIVTGRLDYTADNLPGKKLFARVLGSPYAHALIDSIDASEALALEGVKAVTTYEDCPVFSQEMRYWGQEVAAVAAVDEATAAQAVELIEVQYQELPFVIDPDEAMQPGAPLVGAWDDGNTRPWELDRGDAEAGLAEADVIIEESCGWTNYFQHMPLNSPTGVAYWTGDHVYVWTNSQNPFGQRAQISGALGIPLNRVHLVSHGTGVGHGDLHFSEWCTVAAVLAKKAGQPVQFALSRAENFLNRTHQFPLRATIKLGAKSDGTLTAMDTQWYADVGASGYAMVGGANDSIRYTYKCPNGKFRGTSIITNKPKIGYWRCVAHPQCTYITESIMDRLAEELGMDPLAFRLKNIQPLEAIDQDSDKPLSSNGLRECLEGAANAIGWSQKWHPAGTSTLPDGRMHGIGLTCHIDGHGSLSSPVGAIINLNKDGTAYISSGISRAGGGTNTAHAHIVAETLGMNYVDVSAKQGETDVMSEGGGQGGSTRTITVGAAFKRAAEDARAEAFEVAAGMMDVSADDLDASEGVIFEKANPSNSKTWAEVAARFTHPIVGKGWTWSKELRLKPMAGFDIGEPCEVRAAAAGAVEVAVDTETGEVEILNFVNAADMGRAIFYKGAQNQIEGGAEINVGEALMYEQIVDQNTGETLNTSYIDNKVPTTLDLHTDRHTAVIVEPIDACGPYGCKGLGEPPVAQYGGVANAIYNAIGEWINDPPIYPQKILKALGKA